MDCYAMDVLIRECNGRGDVGMNTHCEQMEWFARSFKHAFFVRLCYSQIRPLQI